MRTPIFLTTVAIAAAAVSVASSSCATVGSVLSGEFERPSLSLKDVEITGISTSKLATRLSVGVQNPNSFAIELAGLTYGFSLENNALANGRTDQKISVPANGSSTIVFPVELGLNEVVAAIGSLFRKDTLGYQARLGVRFASPMGTIEVPLEHSGSFPGPRAPSVIISGVKAGKIGPGGADLEISLDVDNPNSFPLPASALDYRFAIEGSPLARGNITAPAVEGQSKTMITIPLHLDFAGITSDAVAAIARGEARFDLGGSIDVAGSKLPLDTSTALSLRGP